MIDAVRSIADPEIQAVEAQKLQRAATKASRDLARIRTLAVRRLRASGWSHQDVADLLKVRRGNAQRIAEGRGLGLPVLDESAGDAQVP
jgi:hypothetical protein